MKKQHLLGAALLAVSSVVAFAGTDTKDMKEIAAPAPEPVSDASFYVAAYGGIDFTHDTVNAGHQSFNVPGATSQNLSSNIRDVVGGLVGLKFGYRFDSYPISDDGTWGIQPAIEGELIYIDPTIDNNATYNYTHGPDPVINVNTHTKYTSFAGFVNGLARFKTGTLFTPYVGLGVGGQYISSTTDLSVSNDPINGSYKASGLHASDAVFAAQGLAGFDFEVAKGWEIFTEYKYIVAVDPKLTYNFNDPTFGASKYTFNPNYIGQHIITAGLKYDF